MECGSMLIFADFIRANPCCLHPLYPRANTPKAAIPPISFAFFIRANPLCLHPRYPRANSHT